MSDQAQRAELKATAVLAEIQAWLDTYPPMPDDYQGEDVEALIVVRLRQMLAGEEQEEGRVPTRQTAICRGALGLFRVCCSAAPCGSDQARGPASCTRGLVRRIDHLLDDYRDHADTGAPLSEEAEGPKGPGEQMAKGIMRRVTIHFDENDRLVGVNCEASPDVIAQLRACLGAVRVEPGFRGHHVVALPVTDVAKAADWAGKFSELTSPDYRATRAVYECLVYGVCNIFWEYSVASALAGEPSY